MSLENALDKFYLINDRTQGGGEKRHACYFHQDTIYFSEGLFNLINPVHCA